MSFAPADPALFFSRNDSGDPRLGDRVKALPALDLAAFSASLAQEVQGSGGSGREFVIAGYPDDEGIRLNGGRVGAVRAPDAVRKPLYKMTPALFPSRAGEPRLWDVGNLATQGLPLEQRHRNAREFAGAALARDARWIGIGGGHDYGFPDAEAYILWARDQKVRPLVINFDAHLDVRPTDKGITSGTPFFRMLDTYPNVDFVEVGIQAHCNSRKHLDWARAKGARVLTQEELEASGETLSVALARVMDEWILKPRPIFLSIDIDGFSSSVAPGCSQSWATGFMPEQFFPALRLITSRLDVRVLGLYEVSPPLDQDERTSKLAAQVIHRALYP